MPTHQTSLLQYFTRSRTKRTKDSRWTPNPTQLREALQPFITRAKQSKKTPLVADHEPYVKIKLKDTDSMGTGVFATKSIPKGTLVLEYLGERIDNRHDAEERYDQYPEDQSGYMYFVELGPHFVAIDATEAVPEYGFGRYVNHSHLHPNIISKAFRHEKVLHLFFLSSRDIVQGEQLFVDYNDINSQLPWMKNT
ncbi:hypothetical protein RCL1_000578 [Eukaryota sp. TZLM3-RCL]